MAKVVFAIPGQLDTPTGGYIYDRRVLALMPSFGVQATHLKLPDSFPNPSTQDIAKAQELLLATPDDATLIIDGLAFGALPSSTLKPLGSRTIPLIHHPLALKSGLSKARTDTLAASERNALVNVNRVIATSTFTRTLLVEQYAVAPEHITVAEPGTDPAPRATGTGTPLQLLAVGSIVPRKGYDILIDALKPISDLDWRLTIVGATDRDPDAVTALRKQIATAGFGERITLAGVVVPATLARHYDSADIFIMPSHFEGYAMALSEAMVRGLPIVTTVGGASPLTLPDGACLKVPVRDAPALQNALTQALDDRKLRARLADAAWEAGRLLPTWNETARRISAVIMGLHI